MIRLLFALLLFAQTPSVHAADKVDPNIEFGKAHYRKGAALFDAEEYGEALQQFIEAYDLTRRPELLFNIAKCYDRMGKREEAIGKYRVYLDTNPVPNEIRTVRHRIEELEQLIAVRAEVRPEPRLLSSDALRVPDLGPDPVVSHRRWVWGTAIGSVLVVGAVVGLLVALVPNNAPVDAGALGLAAIHF